MGLMTVLASKFMHALCDVKICVAREYLGAVLSVIECWRRRDLHGTTGSVLGTLRDGAMVGIGDGTTLRDGAVVGIGEAPLGGYLVGAMLGRDVASISCRVLMACIFPSPTANRDDGAGLLSASAKSSTAWRAASADESFGTGQLCGIN